MFRIDGIRKRSFQRFRSQGIRASETSVEDVLKLLKILRDFEWCLKDASSPNSASAGERTAGRFCCNRHYLKAMGCRKGSRTHEAAGQNNSSLTSLPALAGNDGWELFLRMNGKGIESLTGFEPRSTGSSDLHSERAEVGTESLLSRDNRKITQSW
jgi:hypothetical protein